MYRTHSLINVAACHGKSNLWFFILTWSHTV